MLCYIRLPRKHINQHQMRARHNVFGYEEADVFCGGDVRFCTSTKEFTGEGMLLDLLFVEIPGICSAHG